ncbi:MAG: hypothetical protein WBP12_03850 [Candidatus Saccharimonas sp.]
MVIVLTIASGLVLFNGAAITDYIAARTIAVPSTVVVSIADEIALTPRGRDILYSTQPILADSASNFPCKSGESNSVILGCYGSTGAWFDKGQIYILDVKNDQLTGVVQVTAAHEMLHAAYQRLNFIEQSQVDQMVRAEYEKRKDDTVLKEQMEYYHLNEPGQDINELHSILATTVATLDPALEQYYTRYFTDRAHVVGLYQQYSQALHKNDETIKLLKVKLDTEAASLGVDTQRYEADLDQLNADIQSFNTRANSGEFSSRSSFELARAALLNRTASLNARSTALNTRVVAYNDLVKQINALSAQTEELYSSLKGVEAPETVEQ